VRILHSSGHHQLPCIEARACSVFHVPAAAVVPVQQGVLAPRPDERAPRAPDAQEALQGKYGLAAGAPAPAQPAAGSPGSDRRSSVSAASLSPSLRCARRALRL